MITLIAALDKNNCVGKDGELPWYLPEDLKHFKKLTTGHTVLMGRKTWESIPEKFRPLPNRTNIVISRQTDMIVPNDVLLSPSLEEALEHQKNEQIFVIGGAQIYAQTIDRADTLEITHIDRTVEGGTAFFPPIDPTIWKESRREDHEGFSFVQYKKSK